MPCAGQGSPSSCRPCDQPRLRDILQDGLHSHQAPSLQSFSLSPCLAAVQYESSIAGFPNFSLAKYLSLHPATKLCQVPEAPRPPSCMDANSMVRSGLYVRWNRTYVRSLIHLCSPPHTSAACPACTTHAQEKLIPWHTPTLLRTPHGPPPPLQRGSCVHTEQSDLGTDSFPRRMGCHRDSVLCVTFHTAAGSNSRQRGTATHPCPTLSTQQHHKLHQPLLKHSLPRQLPPQGWQTPLSLPAQPHSAESSDRSSPFQLHVSI